MISPIKPSFNLGSISLINDDLNKLGSSITSAHRALQIAYKLKPQVIIMIGIDLQGKYGNKVNFSKNIDYDSAKIQSLLSEESRAIERLIKYTKNQGVDIYNLSPLSRLKRNITFKKLDNIIKELM